MRSTTGFPFPCVIYRGDWFRIDRSLQGILYETQKIKLDFSAGGTSVVDSDESDAREGMPDLDPTFEVGPALSLLLTNPDRPDSLRGRMAVRTAVSVDTGDWNFRQQGWVFDTRLRYQRPQMGDTLKLSAEIGASFADKTYAGYFYDVPPEFATPYRPAFESGSGYAGARLGLGFSGVHGKWRWSLFGAYMNFAGTPFEDSPLLDSRHDFSVGAPVGWMFWQSERRVTPKNTSLAASSIRSCSGCELTTRICRQQVHRFNGLRPDLPVAFPGKRTRAYSLCRVLHTSSMHPASKEAIRIIAVGNRGQISQGLPFRAARTAP